MKNTAAEQDVRMPRRDRTSQLPWPKYNSQEYDKETGYYYYNARYYDASVGRFVTPDTVIDGEMSVKGWNRYMYVGGNPVIYKDPTGHNRRTRNRNRYRPGGNAAMKVYRQRIRQEQREERLSNYCKDIQQSGGSSRRKSKIASHVAELLDDQIQYSQRLSKMKSVKSARMTATSIESVIKGLYLKTPSDIKRDDILNIAKKLDYNPGIHNQVVSAPGSDEGVGVIAAIPMNRKFNKKESSLIADRVMAEHKRNKEIISSLRKGENPSPLYSSNAFTSWSEVDRKKFGSYLYKVQQIKDHMIKNNYKFKQIKERISKIENPASGIMKKMLGK